MRGTQRRLSRQVKQLLHDAGWRAWGAWMLFVVAWKKYVVRPYCRRIRKHMGSWAIISGGRPPHTRPILACCRRCYAIAEFDLYNRRINFD